MNSKKQLIIMILNELNVNTDEKNPLTQTQIAKNLSGETVMCDRKTVCRNIKFLQGMGYPIKKAKNGYYMDNKVFSVDDMKFISSAVMAYSGRTEAEKKELVSKIENKLSNMRKR